MFSDSKMFLRHLGFSQQFGMCVIFLFFIVQHALTTYSLVIQMKFVVSNDFQHKLKQKRFSNKQRS